MPYSAPKFTSPKASRHCRSVTSHHSPRQTASIIHCLDSHPPRVPKDPILSHLIYTPYPLRSQYPCAKSVLSGDFNELDTKGLMISFICHNSSVSPHTSKTHRTSFSPTWLTITSHRDPTLVGRSPPLPSSAEAHTCRWTHTPISSTTNSHTSRPTGSCLTQQSRNLESVTQHPWAGVIDAEPVEEKWTAYQDTVM